MSLSSSAIRAAAARAAVAADVPALAALLRDHAEILHEDPDYSGDAQAVIARCHHFDNWPEFDSFRAQLDRGGSSVAVFESAVDAVVRGDLPTLQRLLREHPDLIGRRSTRRHRSTLLIYVGANGVEDFRQRTPPNVVEIAEALLRHGADVDAAGTMYGGSTTIGLVATSIHPEAAGVQPALIDALLAHGASLDGAVAPGYTGGLVVNACLANGRGNAAALLAVRGARLDLEGAAGIGRLELVRRFVGPIGVFSDGATETQLRSGFNWACQYGHADVVEYAIGLPTDLRVKHRGANGLHWAAYNAHTDIVRTLLSAGFSVHEIDDRWQGTPLGWALHGWANPGPGVILEDYYATVEILRGAGADVPPAWLQSEAVQSDRRMAEALAAI